MIYCTFREHDLEKMRRGKRYKKNANAHKRPEHQQKTDRPETRQKGDVSDTTVWVERRIMLKPIQTDL